MYKLQGQIKVQILASGIIYQCKYDEIGRRDGFKIRWRKSVWVQVPLLAPKNVIGGVYNLHLTLAICFVSSLHNMLLSPDNKPPADEDMISTL